MQPVPQVRVAPLHARNESELCLAVGERLVTTAAGSRRSGFAAFVGPGPVKLGTSRQKVPLRNGVLFPEKPNGNLRPNVGTTWEQNPPNISENEGSGPIGRQSESTS